ncbi:MAG: UbiA family prenyltransferase [Actinomycetes bacterium]
MPVARTAVSLLRASHLGPTVAVTSVATALAVGDGQGTVGAAAVAAAVLAGQLAIGWTNDGVDAARDIAAARTDKPVALGTVSVQQVTVAAWVAGLVCLPLSLNLGVVAAGLHVGGVVGSGLVYDLRLKASAWSWAPFAVAFGLLPAVVTWSGPDPGWPPPWVMAAGSLLGVAAHLVNTLPDLADDEAAGVRGLPHRLGPRGTRGATALTLGAATAVLVLGPPGPPGTAGWLVLALGTVALVVALGRTWPARSRTPFVLVAAVAVVDVAVLVASGPLA